MTRRGRALDTLLDTFEDDLVQTCVLHVITKSGFLPPRPTPETDRRATWDVYAVSDAFVLPTNADTSSWVALEAMATGVPVVISNVGGVPEIVLHSQTGPLIPPRDPSALSAAVTQLRTDSSLRTRLTIKGRRRVEQHFDANRNTTLMLEQIKALVDARRSAVATPERPRAAPHH